MIERGENCYFLDETEFPSHQQGRSSTRSFSLSADVVLYNGKEDEEEETPKEKKVPSPGLNVERLPSVSAVSPAPNHV